MVYVQGLLALVVSIEVVFLLGDHSRQVSLYILPVL